MTRLTGPAASEHPRGRSPDECLHTSDPGCGAEEVRQLLNGLVVGVLGARMSSTRANMITKVKLLATTLPSADILRPAPATAARPIPAGAAACTEAHLRMSGDEKLMKKYLSTP
jgi:hypothetical protein